ncbi:Mitochondrial 2-oxoadipate and 2-oxoglutarate transporter, partial [Mortierella claussenii]
MIGISLQQNQFEVVPQFVQSASVEVLMPGDKHQQPQNLKDQKNQKSRPQVHTLPVGQMFQACLTSFDSESEDAEAENAFYVADLGEVYRQHMRWKTLLPRIEPFY